MNIIRTIIWVVVAIALLIFTLNNWSPVEVKIWEDIVLETKKPVLVIISFLVGFLPVWLLHRGTRWQLRRRITSLETAVKNAVTAYAPKGDDQFDPAPEKVDPQPEQKAPE
ncbi:MAG TPA: LapA family protein [Sphingomonadaceae bacterium]|nr:LapA family protein [Sphingomonadaceae bacterium]